MIVWPLLLFRPTQDTNDTAEALSASVSQDNVNLPLYHQPGRNYEPVFGYRQSRHLIFHALLAYSRRPTSPFPPLLSCRIKTRVTHLDVRVQPLTTNTSLPLHHQPDGCYELVFRASQKCYAGILMSSRFAGQPE